MSIRTQNFKFINLIWLLVLVQVFLGSGLFAQEKKAEQKEKFVRAQTEEIVVTATAPQDKLLASTTIIQPLILNLTKTRNVAEVLSLAPGTYVTVGSKAEAHVKIRGLDNDKSTLLLDGIPIYEPYFNMYDLRTIPSYDLEQIKITKGASSVLYGANTLGGIVEVLTKRPQGKWLEINSRLSQNSSYAFYAIGAYTANKFGLKLSASHDETQGYKYKMGGSDYFLKNSDYKKSFFDEKLYFYPNEKSEILFQTSYYDSSYGIPAAISYYSPRYWRFKDWERLTLGLGGTFSIFNTGTIKINTYYVNFYNILDNYTDATFTSISWESTYKNYEAGAFLLGTFNLGSKNELRMSFNGRLDQVRQQGSVSSPWENYKHQIFSFGVEDEWKVTDKWHLIGGFSLDHLKKQIGEDKTTLNPLAGLKFILNENLNFHLSFSQKSRFPSMRALYSSVGGNPDLRDEIGTTLEVGGTYTGLFQGNINLFTSNYKDLIVAIRQPDGTKKFVNIGQAKIAGFEIDASKRFGSFNVQTNYTYLKARNLTESRPLDLIPKSQGSLIASYQKDNNYSLALWLLGASGAKILIGQTLIAVPSYITANISLEKHLKAGSIFLKVENLFNRGYYTEPGYPTPGRRLEAGFSLRIGTNPY
ncbi:MAG: TonB-dependent receptor plug domain-containing protein [Candidatus Saccharicenans sp.]